MVSVTYRDDKAFIIAGISVMGGILACFWLLFLLTKNESMPWFMWIVAAGVSGIAASLLGVFIALLVGMKTIVSERSIAKVIFRKRKEIQKEDISLIAEEALGKGDRFYVVYPKGYDQELFARHKSPYTDILERTKMIQKDRRLLVLTKTKRMSEILNQFGYTVSIIVE